MRIAPAMHAPKLQLSAVEAAGLLKITPRGVAKACAAGKLEWEMVQANGGPQYRIALNSLPEQARRRYLEQLYQREAGSRRDCFLAVNEREAAMRRIAKENGIARKDKRLQNVPWTEAEVLDRELDFVKLPGKVPDGHPNSPAYGHLKLPHLN